MKLGNTYFTTLEFLQNKIGTDFEFNWKIYLCDDRNYFVLGFQKNEVILLIDQFEMMIKLRVIANKSWFETVAHLLEWWNEYSAPRKFELLRNLKWILNSNVCMEMSKFAGFSHWKRREITHLRCFSNWR